MGMSKTNVACEPYVLSAPGPNTGGVPTCHSPHGPVVALDCRVSRMASLADQPVRWDPIIAYSCGDGKNTAGDSD